jgi:hypothetical protein
VLAWKKIKLEEEAINEILVADTASDLSKEAMLKTSLRKNKKKRNNNKQQQQQQQQQQALAEVTITNTGQRTRLRCRMFLRPKKGHSMPDATWACEWCLVSRNSTQK